MVIQLAMVSSFVRLGAKTRPNRLCPSLWLFLTCPLHLMYTNAFYPVWANEECQISPHPLWQKKRGREIGIAQRQAMTHYI